MFDLLEKVAPFLTHYPKWLQFFFFTVLFQVLSLFFLMVVHSFLFANTSRKDSIQEVIAVPVEPASTENQTENKSQESRVAESPKTKRRSTAENQNKKGVTPSDRETTVVDSKNIQGKGFFVASSVLVERKPFPRINVILVNQTKQNQVIFGLTLTVVEYRPYASIPQSRVLDPIAVIDVDLPLGKGSKDYNLTKPILIAAGDAATVVVRASVNYEGKKIQPSEVAGYKIKLVFRTALGLIGTTEAISF